MDAWPSASAPCSENLATFPDKPQPQGARADARASYIAAARRTAIELARGGRVITIEDVRRACPPPAGMDGRALGAVFRGSSWEPMGLQPGSRAESHNRPVMGFRYRGAVQ